MDIAGLLPNAGVLAAAVALDLMLGDPVYPAHPVRLMGRTLTWFEDRLRAFHLDGYGGGMALFALLTVLWVGGISIIVLALAQRNRMAAMAVHGFLVYSLLALHDLIRHAWAVESASRRNSLPEARAAISRLVGRDTNRMDIAACRRAAIESISENLTDGFVSPLFWYAIGGLPALVLFKVVSTMDSMVGYKTSRYMKFGWCGARLDDLMNLLPARLTWLGVSLVAAMIPGASARKALRIGWRQHSLLPGPNSGWSEAAIAGAIERRLAGPIWANGNLVTELWIGDPGDPAAGEAKDMMRALMLVVITGLLFAGVAICLCM